MSEVPATLTRRIGVSDPGCGFRCGKHPLDDYFRRHALANDRGDVGLAYVVEATEVDLAAGLPSVLGFYTLNMATVASTDTASILERKLPRYPMPAALIGRLAVDERAHGRRLGEALLVDALARIVAAAEIVACLGVIVDAKDEDAVGFYSKYDFVTIEDAAWPHRMFLPMTTARAAFSDD